MDDMSIDTSLEERRGIEDTILHSHTVCVNSVEIKIRSQMDDDISIDASLKERRRNKGYNITLTHCV